jgi:cell division protein FtsQ
MNVGNRRVRAPASASGPVTPAETPKPPRPPRAARTILASLKTVAGIVLVAGAAGTVAWTARRHVMTSRRFALTAIDFVGNEQRTSEKLSAETGLSLGANIFIVDLDEARARLLADPWIAEATVTRRLPGALLVRVTERKAAAIVALGETYLATADGEPFKVIEPGDPVDLPVITGLTPNALADDREGAMRTLRRAIDLAFEYEHGGLARRAALEEVHVALDGSLALVVGQDGTRLLLGAPPFRRKLEQAARVVAELDRRGSKAVTIMLDNDTRPERVVARLR